jgi:hypothetical protein
MFDSANDIRGVRIFPKINAEFMLEYYHEEYFFCFGVSVAFFYQQLLMSSLIPVNITGE